MRAVMYADTGISLDASTLKSTLVSISLASANFFINGYSVHGRDAILYGVCQNRCRPSAIFINVTLTFINVKTKL